jgi:hypothetical protein
MQDIERLIRSNEALLRRIGDLGVEAANIGTAMVATGTPAPGAFIYEIAETGRIFTALRSESFAAASSLGLPLPPLETVGSADDLKMMLDALFMSVDALERQAHIADARESAVNVLDRVGMLIHVDHAEFEPLQLCQEQASKLRRAVEQQQQSTEPGAEAIAPFATLLRFVDTHQDLDDDKWASLHDSISGAFDKRLAMAAGRGRLVCESAKRMAPGSAQTTDVLINGRGPAASLSLSAQLS